MELLITGIVCFVAGLVAMAACVRRANKKPNGKTAKFVNALGGGGGPKEQA
jgi:hypothetical protein